MQLVCVDPEGFIRKFGVKSVEVGQFIASLIAGTNLLDWTVDSCHTCHASDGTWQYVIR